MAITVDATTDGGFSSNNPQTVSHTTGSVSDRYLFVGIQGGNGDHVTSVTYNGVAMTRASFRSNGNSTAYLYYLVNPDVGAHDIVVNKDGSVGMAVVGLSFAGAKQAAPEVTATSISGGITTSNAHTLTTLTDNSVHIVMWGLDAFGLTSITNGTQISSQPMGYSNPLLITPAGSHTMTGNSAGGNNNWAGAGAAIAPAPLGGAGFLLNFI